MTNIGSHGVLNMHDSNVEDEFIRSSPSTAVRLTTSIQETLAPTLSGINLPNPKRMQAPSSSFDASSREIPAFGYNMSMKQVIDTCIHKYDDDVDDDDVVLVLVLCRHFLSLFMNFRSIISYLTSSHTKSFHMTITYALRLA